MRAECPAVEGGGLCCRVGAPSGREEPRPWRVRHAASHPLLCPAWVQVGFRTWYSEADPRYIERCK